MKNFLDMLLAVAVMGGLGLVLGIAAMLSGYLHIKDEAEGITRK